MGTLLRQITDKRSWIKSGSAVETVKRKQKKIRNETLRVNLLSLDGLTCVNVVHKNNHVF